MKPSLPLNAQINRLAWPLVLSNLSIPLFGIVDTAMLGRLDSSTHLGAVALGASIVTLVFASLNFLRFSTTGLAAQAKGRNDTQASLALLKQNLSLGLGIALALIVISPFFVPAIITLIQCAEPVCSPTAEYIQIRLFSTPAVLANFVFIGWALAQQNSRLTFISMSVSNVFNIMFDALFILALDMGSAGAAFASVLAEFLGLFISLIAFSRYFPGTLKQLFHTRTPQQHSLWPLIRTNTDIFIRSLCLLSTFTFFHAQGEKFGIDTLAANAILIQLILFQAYFLDGYANATETLIGLAKGKGDRQLYRSTLTASLLNIVLAAIVLMALLAASHHWIVRFFTDIESVITLTSALLWWAICFPIISVWSYWLDGIAIGLSATRPMRNGMLAACFLVFLPLWFSLQDMGNTGLWIAFAAFSFARAIFLLPILFEKRFNTLC